MSTERSKAEFTMTHAFNAPKELVFNAFSQADALNAWWGPIERKNSVISLDFRPGGIFHFKMEGDGKTNYGRFKFITIRPHDLLEFSNGFTDENANPVKAPFDMPFPLEIFYRFVFTEEHGKTTIILTGRPLHASAEEEQSFVSISENMKQVFGATFGLLGKYLAG